MKTRWVLFVVFIINALILAGCNANTVVVEEDSQEAESTELSESEDIVVDEENAETELL